MMQRFTAYVIEVSDFGIPHEVSHRYGDFETLYKSLLMECPGLTLPSLPPKGVDGTDAAVVATRKVELEKLLKAMLSNTEVLMEKKQLLVWKFLNLPNPAVIAARFVAVPWARSRSLTTLAKLNDPKYKDDTYRLAHAPMADILMEGLRELRRGDGESSHWCRQQNGRTSVCQLIAAAMSSSDAGRARFLEMDVLALLLGLVEREESALDDARTALNVIVAREAERFPTLFHSILVRGALAQLAVLASRAKCQEFVAKLLWLAWDAPVRSAFAQPGGQGMRVLQALLRSSLPMCSLLGAVLLAGLVANGDFNSEPSHRTEALKMVYGVLDRPEAASDPQFTKTLCGANSAIVRLAGMLDDADLAPLVLNLLCTAKPPPQKLTRIAGNLASLVGDKATGKQAEETRARAAELLLHIQGSGVAPPSAPATASSSPAGTASAELERCEGITAHEEALESALKTQLNEGVAKSQESLSVRAERVHEIVSLKMHRLRMLPGHNFEAFQRSFSSFQAARDSFEKVVRESSDLHRDMERQLQELRNARPSAVDPQSYKDRLQAAERLYAQVKSQRQELTEAQAAASEKQDRAEQSNSALRKAVEEMKRLDEEISNLRLQRGEKETKATTLRHRANTPGLEQMKEQAKASIERNLQQARELQLMGQRVQQGDPDYLKPGETRESKISEIGAKLAQLKQQQQLLLQQQKDLDFDPVQVGEQASRLETEARELASRADQLEVRRLDLDRERASQMSQSSRESEEARAAQDRRSSLQARVTALEQDARLQMGTLQPMIQEHHAGWQRLLAQQKKLDSDHHTLSSKLEEAGRAADLEAITRAEVKTQIQDVVTMLQGLASSLDQVDGEPSNVPEEAFAAPAAARSAPPAQTGLFAEDTAPPLLAPEPAAAPALVQASTGGLAPPAQEYSAPATLADDFDAFLREETPTAFGTGAPAQADVEEFEG